MRYWLLALLLLPLAFIPVAQATALGSYVFAPTESYQGHEDTPGLVLINHTVAGQRYVEFQSPVPTLVALLVNTTDGPSLRVVPTYGMDDAVLAALLDSQQDTASALNDLQSRLTAAAITLNATAKALDQLANATHTAAAQVHANGRVLVAGNATLATLSQGITNASQQLTDVAATMESLSSQGREHRELAEAIEAAQPAAMAPSGPDFAWAWVALAAGIAVVGVLAYRKLPTRAPTPAPAPPVAPEAPKRRRTKKTPKADVAPEDQQPTPSPQEVEAALRRTLGLDAKGGPS